MRPIEFLRRDPLEAEASLSLFAGYNKIQGMVRCRALGLPTLPGVVIDPTKAGVAEAIAAARSIDPHRYLLRHDRAPETGSYPQGGYVVEAIELPAELDWYRERGRLVILLEPADPLDNQYSASALLTSDDTLQIEIVGPGFDASDLNRGVISPLETYRFSLYDAARARHWTTSIIDKETYAAAKSIRIRKIALKFILRRHSFNVDELTDGEARRLLLNHRYAAKRQIELLLNDGDYVPAPRKFISELKQFATRLRGLINFHSNSESMVAFSASQVNNGQKTIVWDIVLPRRKYALF